MSAVPLRAGYIPLVDAAPLIVARELGFAREEGLALELVRAPSWSALRDLLIMGQVEAAQMLAPVPVAAALGLGGAPVGLEAPMVLSVNGNVVGVSRSLAAKLRAGGYRFDFRDARAAGEALIGLGERLRIGVPFPFSMHAELLFHWLGSLGMAAPQALSVRSVPPPLMADAMAADEIDMFCVGAPWGSVSVEDGSGELLLPASAIWSFAPEKVLALRHGWAEAEPELTGRLMRALWRAGRWLSEPGNLTTTAEILCRPDCLDVPAELISRSLSGDLIISPTGESRSGDSYLVFHEGLANFPWRSQAAWIGTQLAARMGLDRAAAAQSASAVFRADLYRTHLDGLAPMPRASSKLEGALEVATAVPGLRQEVILAPNRFFDGQIFDPGPA